MNRNFWTECLHGGFLRLGNLVGFWGDGRTHGNLKFHVIAVVEGSEAAVEVLIDQDFGTARRKRFSRISI